MSEINENNNPFSHIIDNSWHCQVSFSFVLSNSMDWKYYLTDILNGLALVICLIITLLAPNLNLSV